jgi:hypothetical protein
MRFSPSAHLFNNAMNSSFFGTERIVYCIDKKFPFLYFESTWKRLLGGFLFITQHRNSTCLDTTIYCDRLFIQYISVDMYWLHYRSVSRLICVLNKIPVSLYARASKSSVFSSSVLFFFQKTNKYKLQFLFREFEVFSI